MKYRKGEIINVEVTAIEPYGAFVKVDDVYTGLIHISEINGYYISDIYSVILDGKQNPYSTETAIEIVVGGFCCFC